MSIDFQYEKVKNEWLKTAHKNKNNDSKCTNYIGTNPVPIGRPGGALEI